MAKLDKISHTRRGDIDEVAKTLVAKVAKSAKVANIDAKTVLAKLDTYVSSAAGELGLLSLRPRENPNAPRFKAKDKRAERAIGGGFRGDLLSAIYTRIAMWIMKTGTRSPVVVATDLEIIDLLPLIVGSQRAARFTTSNGRSRPGASVVRSISTLAFDWHAVIGTGATVRAEDSNVDVTFHLSGGGGERRFWFSAVAATYAGPVTVIDEPLHGSVAPVGLSDVMKKTEAFHGPYMQWAEKIKAAALLGDLDARAAVMLIKGVTYAAKGTAYVLFAAVLGGLILFALPARDLQAQVIDRIQQFIQTYVIKNERSDYSLPPRLLMPGAAFFEDEHLEVQSGGGNMIVITVKDPARVSREFQSKSLHSPTLPPDAMNHIEWEWRIRPQHISTPIYKRTENPQLRVILDRPNAWIAELGYHPIHVYHRMSDPIHIPGPGVPPAPPPGPPSQETLDAQDLLVIGNPETYDRPSPGVEEHGWYRLDGRPKR